LGIVVSLEDGWVKREVVSTEPRAAGVEIFIAITV
jgi:hypothetical protein